MVIENDSTMNFKAYVNYYDKNNNALHQPYQLSLLMGQDGSIAGTVASLLKHAKSVGRKTWPRHAHRMSVYIESETSTFHMCEQGAKR